MFEQEGEPDTDLLVTVFRLPTLNFYWTPTMCEVYNLCPLVAIRSFILFLTYKQFFLFANEMKYHSHHLLLEWIDGHMVGIWGYG